MQVIFFFVASKEKRTSRGLLYSNSLELNSAVRLISVFNTSVRFFCLFTSKHEWKYLHIAYGMHSQGRFYAQAFSGYSCIQSKLNVEWGGSFENLKCPYKLGGVQKTRSVRSVAAQSNVTNTPDRSSLVQIYLGSFMWMELRVLLRLLQSITKE